MTHPEQLILGYILSENFIGQMLFTSVISDISSVRDIKDVDSTATSFISISIQRITCPVYVRIERLRD